jgi:hypothetical protein
MPILAAEPSILPENLLENFVDQDPERCWWAAYTKPRQEKSLSRQLCSLNIPHYLPLTSKTFLISGRRFTSQIPLFQSYLFLFVNEDERVNAMNTKRTLQLLPAPRRDEMTQDLQNIELLIKSGLPLNVESRLLPGHRVRVKTGALMGMEGAITTRRGEDRLFIAVRFLGQGVSVQVEDFQVEPA